MNDAEARALIARIAEDRPLAPWQVDIAALLLRDDAPRYSFDLTPTRLMRGGLAHAQRLAFDAAKACGQHMHIVGPDRFECSLPEPCEPLTPKT